MTSFAAYCDDLQIKLYEKYKNKASDNEIRDLLADLQQTDKIKKVYLDEEQLKTLREDMKTAIKNDRAGKAQRIQEYYKQSPDLPQPSLGMIYKFLWGSKDNEEKCKKRLNLYYTLRGTDDDFFGKRAPMTEQEKNMMYNSPALPLPLLTKDLYGINISSYPNADTSDFDFRLKIRNMMLVSDLRVRDGFSLGEIVIHDLKSFTTQHLLKFPINLIRKFLIATEGSLPVRIKQIHIVNCPTFIDKILAIFKPFLKDKITKRLHTHVDGMESLYKYVPRELLPTELGGTLGTLDTFIEQWIDDIDKNKNWFMQEETNVKRLYQEERKNGELFGIEGSFKKLELD